MELKKLSDKVIEKELDSLPDWSFKHDSISKTFLFKDFIEAFAFLSKVAIISEKLNHHPDWSGVYNKVVIQLSTHDVGGITQNDIQFAQKLESYFEL